MANEFRIKNGLISQGAATISGSVIATGNITAPQLFGTASQAVSASWAPSNATAAFPYTGSAEITGSVVLDGFMIQGNVVQNQVTGLAGHAEGSRTEASGSYSHAEGYRVKSVGDFSHAEGNGTQALGNYSHAEGQNTFAHGESSHSEGSNAQAYAPASHAEGQNTNTYGAGSHAEGDDTQTLGDYSHTEGVGTKTIDYGQHAQGFYNLPISGAGAFFHGNGVDNNNRSNLLFATGSSFQITGSTQISGSLYVNGTQITGGGGGSAGVTEIVAGTNITISPTEGTGSVTINADVTTANVAYDNTLFTNAMAQGVGYYFAGTTIDISTMSTANTGNVGEFWCWEWYGTNAGNWVNAYSGTDTTTTKLLKGIVVDNNGTISALLKGFVVIDVNNFNAADPGLPVVGTLGQNTPANEPTDNVPYMADVNSAANGSPWLGNLVAVDGTIGLLYFDPNNPFTT